MIGPRPVVLTETELIEMRHNNGAEGALPGITGLAQVNGRDRLSNLSKANYDGIYVSSISFLIDFKIMVKTFWYVALRLGIREGRQNSKKVIAQNTREKAIRTNEQQLFLKRKV